MKVFVIIVESSMDSFCQWIFIQFLSSLSLQPLSFIHPSFSLLHILKPSASQRQLLQRPQSLPRDAPSVAFPALTPAHVHQLRLRVHAEVAPVSRVLLVQPPQRLHQNDSNTPNSRSNPSRTLNSASFRHRRTHQMHLDHHSAGFRHLPPSLNQKTQNTRSCSSCRSRGAFTTTVTSASPDSVRS